MEDTELTQFSDKNQKWLQWSSLPNGMFLKVDPGSVPKNWNSKELRKKLLQYYKVINFDMKRIEFVINSQSGTPEMVGPPFVVFEERKRRYIHLHVTPIQVRFAVDVSIFETNYRISVADIEFLLAEKDVVYGIDREIIEIIANNQRYGEEFIVALATPPVSGKDASLSEVVPIDPDTKPMINEDGSVDYKRWENIRRVRKDEVICVRTPNTLGIQGTSVFGKPLTPDPGEDKALPKGINTKIIDNETKLVAAMDGFLYRNGRDICVGGVYIIHGDVDFKSGNIEYTGDVVVRGNVNTEFSIVADGTISIDGYVESSAHIESRKQNVFIKGSVFGKNKGKIIAGQNITLSNAQDIELKAGKVLTASGCLMNCSIETGDLIMPSKSQLINSKVYFSGKAKCGQIGGKTETVTEFFYIENERETFKKQINEYNELLKKLDKAIEILRQKVFSINGKDSESVNQRKLYESQLESCSDSHQKINGNRKKMVRLLELMPDKDDLITISMLYPILKVSIYDHVKEFKTEFIDWKIGWRNGAIHKQSLQ